MEYQAGQEVKATLGLEDNVSFLFHFVIFS